MPIDINQFLPTFVEESMEMLQEAEHILLQINPGTLAPDSIHRLFRIMHSIKGNSAAFNFGSINLLTHTLETFLGKVRSEQKPLMQNDIDLIIQSIDCLRTTIVSIKNQSVIDEEGTKKITEILNEKIKKTEDKGPITPPKTETLPQQETFHREPPVANNPSALGWKIQFCPGRDLLQMGDEPTRIFSVLSELGTCKIEVDFKQLPDLDSHDYDPTECYLSWNITFDSSVSKNDLQEVFAWMNSPNTATIHPLANHDRTPTTPAVPTQPAASVRVTTQKIDQLINMMGELVITQSVLNQITTNFNSGSLTNLKETIGQLEQNSRELQSSIMQIRMVPIDFIFNRFPRIVHDLENQLKKKVSLMISGEHTELDKNMIEKLTDPLLHLIRNAIDHGIEAPEIRTKQGKSSTGTIRLHADQEGGHIVIIVSDDGAGLNKKAILQKAISLNLIKENEMITDEKLNQIIFQPGFSTSHTVSEISGRGVGLDVVAKNIEEIGGEIEVLSKEGVGTTFKLRLPLTLAIMDCQLVKLGNQTYIVPLNAISEIVVMDATQLKKIDQKTTLYYFREKYVPIIFLKNIFSISDDIGDLKNNFLIMVEIKNQLIGLVVDELLSQQQVVIKNLENQYKKIQGISGVTVLGDGSIALIIDVKETVALSLCSAPLEKTEKITPTPEKLSVPETNNRSFQFLSFLMSGREFGVDISEVKEICMLEKVVALPNTPHYLKGAINLRGNIIPIIDLYEPFSLPPIQYTANTVIITLDIITQQSHRCIGTIVEQVLDAHTVNLSDILPLPEHSHSGLKPFIRGLITMDGRMITLLNAKHLLKLVTEQEIAS